MSATDDYCELCDLPKSQCIHGQPPPVETPAPTSRPKTRRSTPTRTPGAPSKPVARRWTPPDALKPVVVALLTEAGGELPAETLLERLEQRIADDMRPGDLETTPEGELRWRYAARRARQALIKEGVMVKARPGIWQLA